MMGVGTVKKVSKDSNTVCILSKESRLMHGNLSKEQPEGPIIQGDDRKCAEGKSVEDGKVNQQSSEIQSARNGEQEKDKKEIQDPFKKTSGDPKTVIKPTIRKPIRGAPIVLSKNRFGALSYGESDEELNAAVEISMEKMPQVDSGKEVNIKDKPEAIKKVINDKK